MKPGWCQSMGGSKDHYFRVNSYDSICGHAVRFSTTRINNEARALCSHCVRRITRYPELAVEVSRG